MSGTKFIWMDGRFVKWEDANVHVLTHALHYGSSVFEGVHSYKSNKGTAIFRLREHIGRFLFSASAIGLKINFSTEELTGAIIGLLRKNKLSGAYIRPLGYYGYGKIGVFPKDVPTNVSIITVPWGNYFSKDLRIKTSKFLRHSEKSSIFGAKIGGNYANSILAMREARQQGYDEALMLDEHGFVSEGPAENIFMAKNNILLTPDSKSALHGITRESIIKIARDLGINVVEKRIRLNELKNADELFFCGTATEVAPIIEVDNKKIGYGSPGKITGRIKKKFHDVVRGKDNKYKGWITYA